MKTTLSAPADGGRPVFRYSAMRTGNFLLSLGIMALSFVLYSLGLFGEVEGPLNPARLGSSLASWGLTRQHLIALLMTVAVFTAIWDRLLNAVYRRMGARLVCGHRETGSTRKCGAPAQRVGLTAGTRQRVPVRYVCANGHRCREAEFNPLRKGPVSRSLGLCSLVFLVAIFLS